MSSLAEPPGACREASRAGLDAAGKRTALTKKVRLSKLVPPDRFSFTGWVNHGGAHARR